jgi:putative selenate reductase
VKHSGGQALPIFREKIEAPFGPAAGPNTQLAQNIIAAYAAGARFFELKTVQVMDGPELAACVNKPCITAADECYNCEWSTELEVGQAYEEYVKAWVLIHILAVELDLGRPDDVVFNMSVGYDLDGIKTPKIQKFLDDMIEAKDSAVFTDCIEASLEAVDSGLLRKTTREDILAIPSQISNSVTESTLHGCPPQEIEAIASYLMKEKHLNTYVKCNPTLLGYDFARKTLDDLGFDYVAFDDHHFLTDLQWADAVPMFERLIDLAKSLSLDIGIKLTNTFPVDVKAGELPSEEMYMSGRSLYPLTIQLVSRIAKQFDGKLRISYSGGADYFNIRDLVISGVWPVTMATTLLKPGGYQRLYQIGKLLEDIPDNAWESVDADRAAALADEALVRDKNCKSIKPLPSRKKEESLPLMDCFDAP